MSLIVRNAVMNRAVCRVDIIGSIELTPVELKELLELFKASTIARNVTVRFGELPSISSNQFDFGAINAEIALIEAKATLVTAARIDLEEN